ncbi:hypothetical protein I4U23_004271 [Adineta vaga]|nr:hypothetical protein I4U23_004271 [Adineta vaga]
MDNLRLRAIILNLQDRLSDDDRRRLHFYLGNDVPRRIRDDPTLDGTLSLMETLFDQDKIKDNDFTYLINAFEEIQCFDAARLLKEYRNRNRASGLNESVQSLSAIMPTLTNLVIQDQEKDNHEEQEDKLIFDTSPNHQENNENNLTSINHDTNIDPTEVTPMSDNRNERVVKSNKTKLSKKYILLCILIFFLTITGVILFSYWYAVEFRKLKKNSDEIKKMISETKISGNKTAETAKQLENQLEKFENEIHFITGNLSEAAKNFNKTLAYLQKSRPSEYQNLARTYNNLGKAYFQMENYSHALTNYEKALENENKSLPHNDTDILINYNNIALVHFKMKNYIKSLENYNKTLEIQQKTLNATHPDLAITYDSIGSVYLAMEENAKALEYYTKSLNIQLHPKTN